jgi:hypothetical protein
MIPGIVAGGMRRANGDTHFSNVILLMHMDGDYAGTVFTDSGPSSRIISVTGDAKTDTSNPKFGTACALFDGSGDRLSFSHTGEAFGTGSLTIEFFFNLTEASGLQKGIFGNTSPEFFAIGINASSRIFVNMPSGEVIGGSTGPVIAPGVWYHVAYTRESGVGRLFIEGALTGTSTAHGQNLTGTTQHIGSYSTSAGDSIKARIDELRITKGIARYTSNFTPPTAPFPNS